MVSNFKKAKSTTQKKRKETTDLKQFQIKHVMTESPETKMSLVTVQAKTIKAVEQWLEELKI